MAWDSDARYPVSQTNLKDEVLSTFGVDQTQDTELATLALRFLDQAVKDMNTHLYEFNKHIESSITLVSAQQDYILTSSTTDTDGVKIVPYRECQAYAIKTSDGSREPLAYLPWVRFSECIGNSLASSTGIPTSYSLRNVDRTGVVSLFPKPSASVASTYTLTVEFYKRIPLPSLLTGASTQMRVPEEVETALIYNACKRMAIHLYGPGHPDVAGYAALESKALTELKQVDKTHPDQMQRFMLVDHTRKGRQRQLARGIYIEF